MTQLESLFCFYVTESKPFILTQREYVQKIASAAVHTRDRMRSDNPFNMKRVRIISERGVRGGGGDVGSCPSDRNKGGCVQDLRRARSARFESAISHFTLGQPPVLSLTRSHWLTTLPIFEAARGGLAGLATLRAALGTYALTLPTGGETWISRFVCTSYFFFSPYASSCRGQKPCTDATVLFFPSVLPQNQLCQICALIRFSKMFSKIRREVTSTFCF